MSREQKASSFDTRNIAICAEAKAEQLKAQAQNARKEIIVEQGPLPKPIYTVLGTVNTIQWHVGQVFYHQELERIVDSGVKVIVQ